MKVRREILKARTIILLAGAMGIIAGSATVASAADVMPVKAAPAPVEQGWYFHGGFDVGGRFYAEKPDDGVGQSNNIAKYEEYGKIPSGIFLDWINLDVGTNDGKYRFNFWGKDVGYNAQSYTLDFSEAGKQYLSIGWDETPHLWSTSAETLFSGVGSDTLTVPNSVQNALQAQWSAASGSNAAGLAARNAINNIINNNASPTDLEMDRKKFTVHYRITPTPDWDFNVSYSHEDRTGEKPGQLNYTYAPPNGSFPSNTIGVPVPVDDTTQTPAASGEYIGAGPLGRFNFKLGYEGSIYTDNLTKLTVDNPFSNTGAQLNFGTLVMPLPPSNQAHAFTASGATDIPILMSRFTTTNQYSRWTQDDDFVNSSNNGLVAAPLPASSLNGKVDNFLTNNILTSNLTSTLHNKVQVRYYDHDNSTSELTFPTVVLADSELSTGPFTPEYTSYKKTNVNEDLTWNPVSWFTIGAGYGWERWDRSDNRFATQTDENIGRMFARVQLTNWALWRVSYSYGARRYNSYEIDDSEWLNSRMFDLANRNENLARTLLDVQVTDALTITPNAGLRWDDYPETTPLQTGVSSDHSWNAGVDVGFVVSPTLRLSAGYNYQWDQMKMSAATPDAIGTSSSGTGGCDGTFPGYNATFSPYTVPADCIWGNDVTQTYHTVVASANWKVIPDKLGLRLSYIASWGRESYDFTPCSLNNINCNGVAVNGSTASAQGLPWPDDTNLYQRFDATLRYYFDKDTLRQLGWKGKVIAKLRYTYEHNDGSYWQSDALNAYFGTITGNTELTGTSRSTFLAYDNPNFTAQLIAASLTFKW